MSPGRRCGSRHVISAVDVLMSGFIAPLSLRITSSSAGELIRNQKMTFRVGYGPWTQISHRDWRLEKANVQDCETRIVFYFGIVFAA